MSEAVGRAKVGLTSISTRFFMILSKRIWQVLNSFTFTHYRLQNNCSMLIFCILLTSSVKRGYQASSYKVKTEIMNLSLAWFCLGVKLDFIYK